MNGSIGCGSEDLLGAPNSQPLMTTLIPLLRPATLFPKCRLVGGQTTKRAGDGACHDELTSSCFGPPASCSTFLMAKRLYLGTPGLMRHLCHPPNRTDPDDHRLSIFSKRDNVLYGVGQGLDVNYFSVGTKKYLTMVRPRH